MTPDLQTLRRMIEFLWPELPDLLAENWPQFQAQLAAYLEQSDQQPDRAGVYRALILRLFDDYWPAHERLLELLNQGAAKEIFTVRGLEQRHWPDPASLDLDVAPATVTRYTDIVAPVRVPLHQRFPLIVGLTCAPLTDSGSAQEIKAPPGATIRVVLTSAELEIIGERVKPLTVLADKDSEPAVFYLRAQQPGDYTVLLDFWYENQIVANSRQSIQAVAALDSPVTTKVAPQFMRLDAPCAPHPDLIIRVTTTGNQLNYDLHFANTQFLHFEGDLLRADPEKFRYALIQELEALANQQTRRADAVNDDRAYVMGEPTVAQPVNLDGDAVIRQLTRIGQRLYRDLFPVELRREYRRLRKTVRTLQIISDEPWIPWELIKPYDSEDRQDRVDDDFLCLQYEFTRWFTPTLRPPAQVIGIAGATCIAPVDANLQAALVEQQMVRDWAKAHGVKDHTPVAATYSAVDQLLAGNTPIQLWHFACHGNFKSDEPDQSPLLLENRTALRPGDLVGPTETHLQDDRPLVFLNACRVGATGLALTGLGGWAKVMVQDCGVGAFLAPMWTVDDRLACQFATTFYQTLSTPPTTLAQAVRAARQAVRKAAPNNPVWLAYSVYAHPNAQVQLNPAEILE